MLKLEILITRILRRVIGVRVTLCFQAWQTRHRFAALILLLIIPFTQFAKPRVERSPNTDLYVMF